jgi:quercetin dioxygenase-like cupin family protein
VPVSYKHQQGFTYDMFMESEGVPIHRAALGIDDATQLERAPWRRTGGLGAFIELEATFQLERGMYVAEIPGGGALNPERHLYQEFILVLEGRGLAQVWQGSGEKIAFEWSEGSAFAFPPNTTHQLFNGSREPALLLGITTAPRLMNSIDAGQLPFIFESDYQFVDLYATDNYFLQEETRTVEGRHKEGLMYTNFIADARALLLDDLEQKVAGGQLTGYLMGPRFPRGHVSEWPTGVYHKAHFHGPGAILIGLTGEGYVLAWDSRIGTRPYRDGHGDQVLKVNWSRNSIYSPANGFYHSHFNTGAGPAKHIAVYSNPLPLGVHGLDGYLSIREGGSLLEYEDEDPRIRADFVELLHSRGLELKMPPVVCRDL